MTVAAQAERPLGANLRRLWVTWVSWPITRRWWKLLCFLQRHDWAEAPQIDPREGRIRPDLPPRYTICTRPECQAVRGMPKLVVLDRWVEVQGMILLAKRGCQKCFGRGYTGKMFIGNGVKAAVPCRCLTIQPCYVESVVPKGEKKAS